uniref:Uncharacterized protein n=1 Tax=Anguilla anguilla TaxID=7936 RepID=A0A0E9VDM4_ANGAN
MSTEDRKRGKKAGRGKKK